MEFSIEDIEMIPRFDVLPEESAIGISFPSREVVEVVYIRPEAQNELMAYSIIIATVFVFIGAFIAYLISVRSLKPIKILAEKVENIDANNLSSLIEQPQSNDEIARLANSFNNMLGKLNRSFERQKLFSQNAAHELKTPLTAILTNIEVLQMDAKPSYEEYEDVIDTVKTNTEHLIKLVDGLLSINAIMDEVDCKTFSGKDVFLKIINELGVEIKKKNLNVNIYGDCLVRGNEVLLTRAYLNLIHNSVRYNVEDGFVNVSLSDKGISIEDSGMGIPNKDIENIFEPLYCVDKSRSKDLGGHGLGLAIAKSIFDKNHTKIKITSRQGEGTKIFLTFTQI